MTAIVPTAIKKLTIVVDVINEDANDVTTINPKPARIAVRKSKTS